MDKIKSLKELVKMRDEFKKGLVHSKPVRINVAMATCGIASGARETMNFLIKELDNYSIEADVKQTGCMGYCYAEPTVEVTIAGKEPVIFGYVDEKKAKEIVEKYIIKGEIVDGVIPANYQTIEEYNV